MAIISREKIPSFKSIEQIEIIKAYETRLDNNIPVYTINAGTQELIKIEFIFLAGVRNQSMPLIASATNSMLNEGTSKHNASQIADSIDYYGAFLETSVDYDFASVNLYTLNKHLKNTLPIIEEIIKDSIFPENELHTLMQNKKQKFLVENEKVNHIARKKFNELIFGSNHAYGKSIQVKNFETVDRILLVDFYKSFYQFDNCRMVISGKVNDDVFGLLNEHFGNNNWNNNKIVSNKKSEKIESKIGKNIEVKNDALQSAIRIGKIMFNKTHPDYPKMQVLNTALGGYFGSRLMTNIREDKGYTYGIGSAIVSLLDSGYFFISTEVGVDVCSKAISEIYTELKKLREELIPEEELQLVKNYLLGAFLRSVDGPFALADKFKGIMEYGLDYNYYHRFIQTVKTISSSELRDLANTYLQEKNFTELIVGKK